MHVILGMYKSMEIFISIISQGLSFEPPIDFCDTFEFCETFDFCVLKKLKKF